MAEDPSQIKSHIDNTRRELEGNLHELESRVKQATEWRTYVNKYPLRMVAAAFAGGAVISIVMGRSRRKNSSQGNRPELRTFGSSSFEPRGANYQRHKAAEVLDNIKGALIGLAAAQIKEFFSDAIPGFRQHYEQTERHKTSPPTFTSIH